MAFNINDIKAHTIGGNSPVGGYVAPSLALFTMTLPTSLGLTDKEEVLTLLTPNFNMPGLSFDTTDVKRQGFGPVEYRVTAVNLGARTINVTFFLDRKGSVMKFLTRLGDLMSPYDVNTMHQTSSNDAFLGEVGYYDQYKLPNIKIEAFAPEGDQIIEYNIQDAMLFNYDDVQFGWQQINEIQTVTCQFRFRGFTTNFTEPTAESRLNNRMNLFQFIAKYKGAVEIVKSFKKPRGVQDALNVLNNARSLGSLFD